MKNIKLNKRIRKNKLLMGILIVILFQGILVLAQEEIATAEDVEEAGITPESPLYTLDLFIERIIESFSENAKLNHVKERLAEMKVMIHKNKMPEAVRVKQEFENLRVRIVNQSQIEEHTNLINNLGQKISTIASVKGALNETGRQEIKELIIHHKERIANESEKIINRVRKGLK